MNKEETNLDHIMKENPHFLLRHLAGSYKKNWVKAIIASIFDDFTGVINPIVMQKDI